MSQKSTSKTQQIQPLIAELQRKYANDKEKLNTEMQKIYTKYEVNPMAGCLPMIIRLFVILGFVGVVYNPLQYFLGFNQTDIGNITDSVVQTDGSEKNVRFQVQYSDRDEVKEYIEKMHAEAKEKLNSGEELSAQEKKNLEERLNIEPIDFKFLGINLTKMLNEAESRKELNLWIIPILAVLATVASSFVTKKMMSANANGQPGAGNTMLFIMPVMTAFFTYTMPVGMSLYWFTSTVVNTVQQIFTNMIIKKNKNEIPLTLSDRKKIEGQKPKNNK